mmetsp:Transcript_17051/g.38466  ORF Transcript_17051/g.38466 Transcript_17051/m.38466 type:complete len:105 (+) Transcript_17051:1490-1804(+)
MDFWPGALCVVSPCTAAKVVVCPGGTGAGVEVFGGGGISPMISAGRAAFVPVEVVGSADSVEVVDSANSVDSVVEVAFADEGGEGGDAGGGEGECHCGSGVTGP